MSFIAASCRLLWLQHHAGFTATWAAAATSISSYSFIVASDATPILLWDYTAMKAVWDHTKSFLRHHCRLWLRHHAGFTCGITADLILRLIGRLAWSLYCSSMSSCDFHVVLYLYSGIDATSTRRLIGRLAASSPTCGSRWACGKFITVCFCKPFP